MPAYKDEQHGTFYASFYYTDFTGARRKKMKIRREGSNKFGCWIVVSMS